MTEHKKRFRLCRRCGQTWNVSCLEPGEKVYICPVCDYKARREARARREAKHG